MGQLKIPIESCCFIPFQLLVAILAYADGSTCFCFKWIPNTCQSGTKNFLLTQVRAVTKILSCYFIYFNFYFTLLDLPIIGRVTATA